MRHSFRLILALTIVWLGSVLSETVDKTVSFPLTKRPLEYSTGSLAKRQQQDQHRQRIFNSYGDEYQIEVGVGTPPQKFNLSIDTGSMAMWIPSPTCPSNQCTSNHFNPAASSTFKGTTEKFEITYVMGSVNATYAYDSVTVANLTVTQQEIGLANNTQYMFYPEWPWNADGVLGLSCQGVWEVPFVFNLVKQNLISQPVFSLFLNAQKQVGYSGEITFGGIDTNRFEGNISYFDIPKYPIQISDTESVEEYLFWTLPGAALSTTTGYSITFDSLQHWILDTGSPLSYAPAPVLADIVANITNNEFRYESLDELYYINCSLAKSSAQLEFHAVPSFNDPAGTTVKISIPLRELVVPLNGTDPTTASTCFFGVAPTATEPGAQADWTLGLTFLRSVYTVHDMGNYRVGIAAVKGLSDVEAPSNGGEPSDAPGQSSAPRLAFANVLLVQSVMALFIATLMFVS